MKLKSINEYIRYSKFTEDIPVLKELFEKFSGKEYNAKLMDKFIYAKKMQSKRIMLNLILLGEHSSCPESFIFIDIEETDPSSALKSMKKNKFSKLTETKDYLPDETLTRINNLISDEETIAGIKNILMEIENLSEYRFTFL